LDINYYYKHNFKNYIYIIIELRKKNQEYNGNVTQLPLNLGNEKRWKNNKIFLFLSFS